MKNGLIFIDSQSRNDCTEVIVNLKYNIRNEIQGSTIWCYQSNNFLTRDVAMVILITCNLLSERIKIWARPIIEK